MAFRLHQIFRSLLVAVLVLAAVAVPAAARADTKSQRDEVQQKRAAVAADIDTLRATNEEVEAALRTLSSNVDAQRAELRDAERRSAEAEAALAAATAEVEAKVGEIAELDEAVKELAIAAYIQPPSSAGLIDSLAADNIGEAELKRSLLEAKSSNQLDVLDQLERAREDLETARAAAADATVVAQNNREAVSTQLNEVTQARDQQAQVVADVEARLDRQLAEAQGLAELDAQLSEKLQLEQASLAAQLAKQRAADQAAQARSAAAAPRASSRGGGGGGSGGGGGRSTTIAITGSGSIVSVRGIRVHRSIAGQLASLLSAAEAGGISMSGGGYRDPAGQIAVRRNNCGTSNYAVYQMPASSCSPPTARPGQSMHEQGLAVDFTYGGRTINSRSSPAFRWMAANAASYGFYNLPSEPWHWSVNGN
ncbi:MAG: D-alanyl-D-alanine carboxypeptidase family protein [Acidimicrobiales bacterium]